MQSTAQQQQEKELLRQAMAAKVAFKQWQATAEVRMQKYEWATGSVQTKCQSLNTATFKLWHYTLYFGIQTSAFILQQLIFKWALPSDAPNSTLPKLLEKEKTNLFDLRFAIFSAATNGR